METIRNILDRKILVLDGAMGTMIQQRKFTEEDFRGSRFTRHASKIAGCNDALCLTQPDAIADIHRQYIEAGADIISTNSFNANAISLSDYGLEHCVAEINRAAARIARQAADQSERKVWVAGSVGPSNKSLLMSRQLGQNWGEEAWDALCDTYTEQMAALIEGGADIILLETQYDTLNTKAGIWSYFRAMEKAGKRVEIIISATLTESGRLLTGQSPEAFIATVAHAQPLAVGLNCGFGADAMMRFLPAFAHSPFAVSAYSNAGHPDAAGRYSDTPEAMAAKVEAMLKAGLVNIVGGCCGTTPEHIRLISGIAKDIEPRHIPLSATDLTLAGIDPCPVGKEAGFIDVGERCNVAGSRKFLRLINEGDIDQCVEIAAQQCTAGASIIDINMDDPLLDAPATMERFISALAAEAEVAKRPIMVDTSNWTVATRALKSIGGRPVINSISLKEGEEEFLARARHIKEMGAVPIVMAFDEQGQADTLQRRIEVCQRAYALLTEKVGLKGEEIIFDPNVLAVATGIAAHNNYAKDFLDATEWIKQNLPGAKVSGGVSNLSFSFRGNNTVREAMHSLFLFHAAKRGMDMAIVNPSALPAPDSIDPQLAKAIEDVLFNTDPDAPERLMAVAVQYAAAKGSAPVETQPKEATLEQLLITGHTAGLDQAVEKALAEQGSAMKVIEGPLMDAMGKVGSKFGKGEMFLPQVVKSATVMKQAVAILQPLIEQEKQGAVSAGKIVLATVKGDVHDIGKNIVAIVLSCNGYEVIDLGVMTPTDAIIAAAKEYKADAIGLSGLITPSLDEMCKVAAAMEAEGMTIPLFVGGAAASEAHTALKIAPMRSAAVVYTSDAASLPPALARFLGADRDEAFEALREKQSGIRASHGAPSPILPLSQARSNAKRTACPAFKPKATGVFDLEPAIDEVLPLINWRAFLAAWKINPSHATACECAECNAQAAEAQKLIADAKELIAQLGNDAGIKARVAILPARSQGDDIVIDFIGNEITMPMLRAQSGKCECVADFLRDDADYIGVFAVTAGHKLEALAEAAKKAGDEYRMLLAQSTADRIAEASTEWLHRKVCAELWEHKQMIRPAFGYPSIPYQGIVHTADMVIDYASMGIAVTENGALKPSSTTSGFIIANPESRYFPIGAIDNEQRADYAHRADISIETLNHFLPK